MSVMGILKQHLQQKDRADLAGAVAAGLCAGVVRSLSYALNHDPAPWTAARWIIIGVAAFVVVAKLLQLSWKPSLNRVIPRWIVTAFVGSILFIEALLAPRVIERWYDPFTDRSSLMRYLLAEISYHQTLIIDLTLITLPVLWAFHYAEQIAKAAGNWRSGSPPPSIIEG